MNVNIPTSILRTLVSVVETGSMISASDQVFLSQSAISFQIKKLESMINRPIFYRDGKRLLLTEAGKMLYEYAGRILRLHDEVIGAIDSHDISRPIRIGLVQDFSDKFLQDLLSLYSEEHLYSQVYIKVTRTVHLKRLISEGELDIAIGFSEIDDAAIIDTKENYWFGSSDLLDNPVLPLALLEHPCRFRDTALNTFEKAGIPYRISVEAPNLSALRAAVDAGIGLTCRTLLFGDGSRPPINDHLPDLPGVGVSLYQSSDSFPATSHLLDLAQKAIKIIS